MSFTKDQLLYLQQILSHEQWEKFESLGENGRLSLNNSDFVKEISQLLIEHDIYSICKGWGKSAVYTRLSYLLQENRKFICIDNIIKISIDGDTIGQIYIMIDDVIYKDFHSNLKDNIINYDNLKGLTKKKIMELLTILNNFRNTVYITNKLIYNKIFTTEFTKNNPKYIQYLIPITEI